MRLFQTNRYLLLAFLICAASLSAFFYSFQHGLTSYMNAALVLTVLFIALLSIIMAYGVYPRWSDDHTANYQNLLQMAGKQVWLGVMMIVWGLASWIIYFVFMPEIFPAMPALSLGMNTFWLDRAMVFPFLFFWLSAGILLHRNSGIFSVLMVFMLLSVMYLPATRVLIFKNLFVHNFLKGEFASVFSPFASLQVAIWLVLVLQVTLVLFTLMLVIHQASHAYLQKDKNSKAVKPKVPTFVAGNPMGLWGQLGWYLLLISLTVAGIAAFVSYAPISPERSFIFSDSFVLNGAIGFIIFVAIINIFGLFQIFWKVQAVDLFRINTILIAVPLLWSGGTLLYYFITQQHVFIHDGARLNVELQHISTAIAAMFGISAGLLSFSIMVKEKISIYLLAFATIALAIFSFFSISALTEFYTFVQNNVEDRNKLPFAPRLLFMPMLTATATTLFWALSLLKSWSVFFVQHHQENDARTANPNQNSLFFTAHLFSKQMNYGILSVLLLSTGFLIVNAVSHARGPNETFALFFFGILMLFVIVTNALYIASWVYKEQQQPNQVFHINLLNAVFFALPFFVLLVGRLGGLLMNLLLATPSPYGLLWGFDFPFLFVIFIGLLLWGWVTKQFRSIPSGKTITLSAGIAFFFFLLSSYYSSLNHHRWELPQYWSFYNWFISVVFLAALAAVIWRKDQQQIKTLKAQLAA